MVIALLSLSGGDEKLAEEFTQIRPTLGKKKKEKKKGKKISKSLEEPSLTQAGLEEYAPAMDVAAAAAAVSDAPANEDINASKDLHDGCSEESESYAQPDVPAKTTLPSFQCVSLTSWQDDGASVYDPIHDSKACGHHIYSFNALLCICVYEQLGLSLVGTCVGEILCAKELSFIAGLDLV